MLSFDAFEAYQGDTGRTVEKRVMLTLDESASRALYEYLRERFESKTAKPGEDMPGFEMMRSD